MCSDRLCLRVLAIPVPKFKQLALEAIYCHAVRRCGMRTGCLFLYLQGMTLRHWSKGGRFIGNALNLCLAERNITSLSRERAVSNAASHESEDRYDSRWDQEFSSTSSTHTGAHPTTYPKGTGALAPSCRGAGA